MNFGLVLAANKIAFPIWSKLNLKGTATFLRCMPIRVPPISKPASAAIDSTTTGFLKVL